MTAKTKLGVIADDFTGASDIASFLTENGLKTVQMNGIPTAFLAADADAIVVSLKSRSNPVAEAVEQSLSALEWLKQAGCNQFYFKYCSTFDSTAEGNIGPVTDALLTALGEQFTVICPALPVNGRTIFNGYLFVGEQLLNESGMQNHPITPMRDANLCRLMDAQAQGKTGLVQYQDLLKGAENVKAKFGELQRSGFRYAVCDAVDNSQLGVLAEAVADLKLVTGGSGLSAYMAACLSGGKQGDQAFVPTKGKTVVFSGSCSLMTNKQVAAYQAKAPSLRLSVGDTLNNPDYVPHLCQWVLENLHGEYAPMVYATVNAEELHRIQAKFGKQQTSEAIEQTFAKLAKLLLAQGVSNFITAGGETSSIVVQELGFSSFHIGKQIAPGVPWLKSTENPQIYLALKSGNFGQENFFSDAQEMMK